VCLLVVVLCLTESLSDGWTRLPFPVSLLAALRTYLKVRRMARCLPSILIRFSVDGNVSTYLNHTIQITIALLTEFAAVFILTPSFFFVGIIVAVLGGYCGQVYIKAQLSVKREMSNAKAPILAQ
jgi:hypothetical protein